MRGYLLDTNILSDLIRNFTGPVAAMIDTVGEDSVATSIIVAAELRYGAAKRKSAKLADRIDGVLSRIDVIAFDVPMDSVYGEIRAGLEVSGMPISNNDLLIAAHAIALNRCLVTANTREFERVPGLKIENWLQG